MPGFWTFRTVWAPENNYSSREFYINRRTSQRGAFCIEGYKSKQGPRCASDVTDSDVTDSSGAAKSTGPGEYDEYIREGQLTYYYSICTTQQSHTW